MNLEKYTHTMFNLLILVGLFLFMLFSQSIIVAPSEFINGLKEDYIINNIIVVSMSILFTVVSILLIYHLGGFKNKPRSIYPSMVSIIVGLLLIFILKFILSQVVVNTSQNQIIVEKMVDNLSLTANIFYLGIFTSVTEELVFRFGIMHILFTHKFMGLVVSSLMFGLSHNINNLYSGIFYISMGFILGTSYFYTDRVEVPIILHIINNILGALLI